MINVEERQGSCKADNGKDVRSLVSFRWSILFLAKPVWFWLSFTYNWKSPEQGPFRNDTISLKETGPLPNYYFSHSSSVKVDHLFWLLCSDNWERNSHQRGPTQPLRREYWAKMLLLLEANMPEQGRYCSWLKVTRTSQVALVVKNPPDNAADITDEGSIPGSGRSPGGGHGNPLQYSCLENRHGQRSLAGPQDHKESERTEAI